MKRFFAVLLFFILIGGCEIIEIVETQPTQKAKRDSLIATCSDTVRSDTTRYPISFDVSVKDWENIEIDY